MNAVVFRRSAIKGPGTQLVTSEQTLQQQEMVNFNATSRQLMDDFPIFDPDAPEFEPAMLESAITLRDTFSGAGRPLTEALLEAVDLTLHKHRPDLITTDTPAEKDIHLLQQPCQNLTLPPRL